MLYMRIYTHVYLCMYIYIYLCIYIYMYKPSLPKKFDMEIETPTKKHPPKIWVTPFFPCIGGKNARELFFFGVDTTTWALVVSDFPSRSSFRVFFWSFFSFFFLRVLGGGWVVEVNFGEIVILKFDRHRGSKSWNETPKGRRNQQKPWMTPWIFK